MKRNSMTKKKSSIATQINERKNYPRSYRFDSDVLDVLKSTLQRINKIAPRKISEARLLKALIVLSKEIEDEKIIKALKEIW